jgi:hypothetical protein
MESRNAATKWSFSSVVLGDALTGRQRNFQVSHTISGE